MTIKRQITHIDNMNKQRRQLLLALSATGIFVSGVAPKQWTTPIINSVMLPAHAQTSVCMTDATVGGPLIGNSSGALNCQDACEAEATDQNAQLCAVEESVDGNGATQCSCDLDLP